MGEKNEALIKFKIIQIKEIIIRQKKIKIQINGEEFKEERKEKAGRKNEKQKGS